MVILQLYCCEYVILARTIFKLSDKSMRGVSISLFNSYTVPESTFREKIIVSLGC